MKRNLEIDRLRAVAIILTIFSHFDFLLRGQPHWYKFIFQYIFNGCTGVILFFAISGYVICKSFAPVFDQICNLTSEKINYCYVFLIKRWYRLTPIAYFWITLFLIILIIFNKLLADAAIHADIRGAIASYLYVFNIFNIFDNGKSMYGIYWSLGLEEQFYLIFPVFMLVFRQFYTRILILLIAFLLLNFIPSDIRPAFRVEAIILGLILYLFEKEGFKLNLKGNLTNFKKNLIVFILLFLLSCPSFYLSNFINNYYMGYYSPALISIVLVWLASLEINFIFPNTRTHRVLDWIGTRSYGIYLAHIPIMYLAGELGTYLPLLNYFLIRLSIFLTLGILSVELSYRYIELPLRLKGRIVAKKMLS